MRIHKFTYIAIIMTALALCSIYIINMIGGSDTLTSKSSSTKEYYDFMSNSKEDPLHKALTSDVETAKLPKETTGAPQETTEVPQETPRKYEQSHKAAKKQIDFNAEHPFLIKVNRAENFAIAYGIDKNGRYTIPYKAFLCSTGLHKGDTPVGIFKMSDKYRWRMMVDDSYAQYAIRINGPIMLHSIPYYYMRNDSLESEEYNKLGTAASLGCVRFDVKSIKWLYDHCTPGSTVMIYDLEDEIPPIEIPELKKIDLNDERANWDPTDPDKDNPWNNSEVITWQKNITP